MYLRGRAKAVPPDRGEPQAQTVDADHALLDGISRSVMSLFESSIRASVIAAVRALAPHMVITFPEAREPNVHTATAQGAPTGVTAVDDEVVDTPHT